MHVSRYFERAPGLFCVLGLDGQITAANREWQQQLGLPWTEIQGRQWLAKMHVQDTQVWNSYIQSVPIGNGNISCTVRLRNSDGAYRWLLWNANVDIQHRQILATIVDVTEDKEAYISLQQSEQRLARAIRGTRDGIWEWDLLTDEVYLSQRYK